MDIKSALEKLFAAYTEFQKMRDPQPGLGEFFIQYPTKQGVGFFYVILSPPRKRETGKKKDLDKALNRSAKANKPILPKDFEEITAFLNQNFTNIVKPKAEIMDRFENYIAGLRLELVPSHNMKYVFNDPSRPELFAYFLHTKNQYIMYLNIVAVHEDGLVLAHDHQIKYIKEALKKNINPNQISSLPGLQTGETELEFSRAPNKIQEPEEENPRLVGFREKVRQKRLQGEIDDELAFETVIDFSNKGRASIMVEDPPSQPESTHSYNPDVDTTRDGDTLPDNLDGSLDLNNLSPLRHNSPTSNGFALDPNDQTRMVGNFPQNSSLSHESIDIPSNGFENIPKPAPLSKESVLGEDKFTIDAPEIALSVPAYEKPAPMVFPSSSDASSSSVFPISQPTSNEQVSQLLEEKELIQSQLETVTAQMESQLQEKDEIIQRLQEESDEKMERLRGQFAKIQGQVQPLIEENNKLRQQQTNLAQDHQVTENIQLINRNLTLQENLDQALIKINQLEQLLKENDQKIALSQQYTPISSQDDFPTGLDSQPSIDSQHSVDSPPSVDSSDITESPLSSALRDSFRKSKDQLEHQIKTQEEQEKREK
ncbi:MAG: hypothetical protein E4G98_03825 [Promethearchaeota archaeon]|nr:MAG: hypothetical protein E4G98_03825 [Candidatus Lokiarchaeota archaeon]